MKLKAVEMHGFKSFPNKTRIEFGDGITAIIGPNGSGKSNVSDSVRWVLGEMSVKSLRGTKMEDIIFNGAAGVSPSNSAAVSLILDTSSEFNIANESDEFCLGSSPETVITRKYYRNGDSEYYINKKQVRLKDIYELFYDTGIGREGYSVIGQGKISEVLSQKDEDRRSIFEEAAGISGFRYKKLDAERRLRDTEANLIRVDDIVSEISSRLAPLEKDAENAKAYLALSSEKKGLEVTLWLERLDTLKMRLSENKNAAADAKLRNDKLDERITALEAELDKAINETYEISQKTAVNERQIAEKKQSTLTLEGESAVLTNDISHLDRQIAENKAQAELSNITVAEKTTSLIAEQQKLAETKEKFSAKTAAYEALMQRYSDQRNALAMLLEKQSSLTATRVVTAEQLAKQRVELASKSAQSGAFVQRLQTAKTAVTEAQNKQTVLEAALKETQEKSILASAALEDGRKSTAALAEDIAKTAAESESTRLVEDKLKLEMAAKEQKKDSLERLERLFEGYSDSVKSVVTAARKFELKANVYGPVSSVISVDNEYAAALECTLGGAVQYIIVGSEDDAKGCIEYLKRNRAGRATFLPLTSVKGTKADVSKIKRMPGYIGIASEIIKTDEKFRGIADDLLGRTIVADNMDNAAEIAKASGYRLRIVTKDAQLIQPGGHFTGGSELRRTGILTRTLDIERLSEEIKALNESLLELQSKRNSQERELQRKRANLEEQRLELSELEKAAAISQSEIKATAAALEDAKSVCSKLVGEYTVLTGSESGAAAEIETLTTAITALEAQLKALDNELEAVSSEVGKRGEADRSLIDEVGEYKLSLATLQNEIDNLSASVIRINEAVTEAQNKVEYCLAQQEIAQTKAAQAKQRITELRGEIEANTVQIEVLVNILGQLSEAQKIAQERINSLRAESKDKSVEKEAAFRELTELNAKAEGWDSEYTQLMEKLWDEYELTFTEADTLRLPPEKMDKAATRLNAIKNKIRSLGSINVNAVEEYKVTKERYDFLTTQIEDLRKTQKSLDNTIDKLEANMRQMFLETFDKINKNFGIVFTELFGGGTAYVELLDPSDPLISGIDIIVKPPGKTIKNISLLSGGEQSFAAIALYLSLQRINPSPFCIFDEIDTALDEVNVAKLADYVKRNGGDTQYIFITHRRGTMERANRLYGIMMPHKGVSEYLTLDLSKLHEREQMQFELR